MRFAHPLAVTRRRHARPAFTLVELLTVVFIISLLIAILIPALSAARNTAKGLVTKKAISAIEAGMELFKNEQGKAFAQTNGYPPSFVHPPIPGFSFRSYEGRFPYVGEGNPPKVYGAHFLPFFLMGLDAQGFIARKDVPDDLRAKPWEWYKSAPDGETDLKIPRAPLYVDPNNLRRIATTNLPGQPGEAMEDFMQQEDAATTLPVIVDAFDQPILYYVANRHGRPTNMVEDEHRENNDYSASRPQMTGPPFYFHQDNEGFTGTKDKTGWNFGSTLEGHAIADPGEDVNAATILLEENRKTFARYILDRKIYSDLSIKMSDENDIPHPGQRDPLRPVNADTYLLISPGVDGLYGTSDDVSNMPPFPDN